MPNDLGGLVEGMHGAVVLPGGMLLSRYNSPEPSAFECVCTLIAVAATDPIDQLQGRVKLPSAKLRGNSFPISSPFL